MAETDWTEMQGTLDVNNVSRGVSNGIPRPPGGGNFAFGFNSRTTAAGAVGFFYNRVGFAPMPKGMSMTGVMQRAISGGPVGFSPFFMVGLQDIDVTDSAYLLGLSDEDPHRIVVKKGTVATGIPASAAQGAGILAVSTQTFASGTYVHLRFDMTMNTNGDVLLDVFQNDLAAQPIGVPPVWESVPGLSTFIDDALGINSGSLPFTSGRAGFGFQTEDVTRRSFFDHIEIVRQD